MDESHQQFRVSERPHQQQHAKDLSILSVQDKGAAELEGCRRSSNFAECQLSRYPIFNVLIVEELERKVGFDSVGRLRR